MNDFWSACLNRFERELPAQQFNTWIKGLHLEQDGTTEGQFRLVAPNRFVMQWVRERYLNQIEALGKEFFAAPVSIVLGVAESARETPLPVSDTTESASAEIVIETRKSVRSSDPAYEKTRLNADFTFDTLVTGRANDLARAAAQQVAINPGVSYNPLFIYGGVGQDPPDTCHRQRHLHH